MDGGANAEDRRVVDRLVVSQIRDRHPVRSRMEEILEIRLHRKAGKDDILIRRLDQPVFVADQRRVAGKNVLRRDCG